MSIMSLPVTASLGAREKFRSARTPRAPVPLFSPDSLSFVWVDAWHPGRSALEGFISRVFLEGYGARLSRFHDTLIGCADERGHWIAAVGYSALSHRAALLEQYLDRPVEQEIERVKSQSSGPRRVSRWDVVEVGNLAATRPGAARALILKMTQFFHKRHFRWVVFTATRGLTNSFARLHYQPAVLAPADPDRLEGDRQQWGSYYDHEPRVVVGDIHAAHAQFFGLD
jgi:hypothetical protein